MGFAKASILLAICAFTLNATCLANDVFECDENECQFELQRTGLSEDANSTKFQLTVENGLVSVSFAQSVLFNIPASLFADGNGMKIDKLDASASNVLAIDSRTFANASALEYLNLQQNYITELQNNVFGNATKLISIELQNNKIADIGESSFQGLAKLDKLQLSFNRLGSLPRKLFAGLRRLNKLYLAHNGIIELPDRLFEDLSELTVLDLSYNDIKKLTGNTFVDLPQLNTLELQHNRITTVEDNTFSMPNLTHLDLSNNRLKHLPKKLIRHTVALLELVLSNNSVDHLDRDLFENVCYLETLKLDHNKLRSLDGALFRTLGKLEYLYLENNNLRQIVPGTFDNLKKLRELNLMNNGLTSIDGGLFLNLRFVTYLRLDRNKIRNVTKGSLGGLVRLKQLNLDQNKIKTIDSEIFCQHQLLRTLSLKGNKLTRIAPETFNCLLELFDLDLSSNRLENISLSVESLRELDLSNNRLRKLSDDAFLKMNSLHTLNMDNNLLDVVPSVITKLPNLKMLSLKNNNINSTALDGHAEKLWLLRLSNNAINHIIFKSYPNLIKLYLDGNRIKAIPENTFSQTRKLNVLDLAENQLTGPLEESFFNYNINELRLDGNPLGHITNTSFAGLDRFVEVLSLKNTNLSDLGDNPFHHIDIMKKLDLSGNSLSKIGTNLRGTYYLRELHVSDNRVSIQELSLISKDLRTVSISAIDVVVPDNLLENVTLNQLHLIGSQFSGLPTDFFQTNKEYLTDLTISNNKEFTKLPANFFKDLSELERLTLANNSLVTLEPGVFDPLVLLQLMNISNNPLKTLDTKLFNKTTRLTTLILRNVNVTHLPLGIFDSLVDLVTLDLGGNQISSLPNGIFRKQYPLESISLEGNAIEQLDPAVFEGVSRLKKIDLSHNKISTIHPQLFANLLQIDELDLGYNKFVSFDLTATGFQNALSSLTLDGNGLTSLKISPTLEILSADDNQLSTIEVNQAKESPSVLTQLSAERNRFTNFDCFVQFKALTDLHLSFNKFTELDTGAISSQLQALRELSVSDSHVQRVKTDGINEQDALTYLDISNNNLTSLELDAFGKFSSLKIFVFGGNRFETFSISDLLAAFEDLESIGLEGTQWKCDFLRTLDTPMRASFIGEWLKK
ncbi:AGAP007060-PA-like protein [Anopheles sinensis]|uniref:AGAP007060-PA-like protein n=1 Tax=Anopheles sinensis TaxID=74873 RepID=A0A084WJS2_ANOSI|nr:AGAP007060-PA-like protein [Anopheles sinensis]